jgi:hypothetical protein
MVSVFTGFIIDVFVYIWWCLRYIDQKHILDAIFLFRERIESNNISLKITIQNVLIGFVQKRTRTSTSPKYFYKISVSATAFIPRESYCNASKRA